MIEQHNQQFHLGLHSYALQINRFADLVNKIILFSMMINSSSFFSKTNEEFRKQMNRFQMNSNEEINGQIYSSASNVVLPDSVGKMNLNSTERFHIFIL